MSVRSTTNLHNLSLSLKKHISSDTLLGTSGKYTNVKVNVEHSAQRFNKKHIKFCCFVLFVTLIYVQNAQPSNNDTDIAQSLIIDTVHVVGCYTKL